ncbi:hypothetical protein [Paraburkholderia sp. BR14374]|uniref:hypothetical protein n=1 Tax=Paraburkholderia sp. BR14374 TaxID=3237007 RepID=UPI0034CFE5A6
MTHLAGILNVFGLGAKMVGVVVLFFFGFPQPTHDEGVGLALQDATPLPNGKTVAEHNASVRRRRVLYRVCSTVGLALLFVGFVLQLPAAILAIA